MRLKIQDSRPDPEVDAFYLIHKNFLNIHNILGVDISTKAIEFANNHYRDSTLFYKTFDILKEDIKSFFDISVSSNTLEHFKNPHYVIDKMLSFSKNAIILVPYMQPCNENYEGEGGAGHVFTFSESTFDKYEIIDYFIFKTNGWTFSSKGEDPLQLAILFTKSKTLKQ